jgi:hypothetical protein
MEEDVSYARIGYLHNYLENAIFFYNEYKKIENDHIKAKAIFNDFYHPEYENYKATHKKADRDYLSSFLFLSLFLEAYIYDFAARRLSDSYVTKYLDKLDVISKWIIIPKLITGKELDTSRHSFAILKQIFSLRNKFVHHKTSEITIERVAKYNSLDELIKLSDILSAIADIFKQLDKIDTTIDSHQIYISNLP